MTPALAMGLVGASFAVAVAAVLSFGPSLRRQAQARQHLAGAEARAAIFLFDDVDLVDATPAARHILAAAPKGDTPWARFLFIMSPRFPDLDDQLARLAETGRVEVRAAEGPGLILAEWREGLGRITVQDGDGEGEAAAIDSHDLRAMERELDELRLISGTTASLIWRQDRGDRVLWANRAYLDCADDGQAPAVWPPRTIFGCERLGEGIGARHPVRLPAELSTGRAWFDCHVREEGGTLFVTAIDAGAAVAAEEHLRSFTQTLTKTFSHLTIGLAVFDRARRLVLFNPALLDLTGLPAIFLTGRPPLTAFLDQLRDRRVMPEPRDYKEWRRTIAEMEAGAADGTYQESWALPGGGTYRITGRPHPDGAVAFLLEDISAEISLTRRFRTELELGQSVIDATRDAVAVFTPEGVLTLTNAAYADLWGHDPSGMLSQITVTEATRLWAERAAPTPFWGDLRTYVSQPRDRAEWGAELRMADGRPLHARVVPLSGGAAMVAFEDAARPTTAVQPLLASARAAAAPEERSLGA